MGTLQEADSYRGEGETGDRKTPTATPQAAGRRLSLARRMAPPHSMSTRRSASLLVALVVAVTARSSVALVVFPSASSASRSCGSIGTRRHWQW